MGGGRFVKSGGCPKAEKVEGRFWWVAELIFDVGGRRNVGGIGVVVGHAPT